MDEIEPKVGEKARVFYGSNFYRSGYIASVNRQDRVALVRFDYDLPDEWVAWSKLC
jgi:hypothetical protein